jgi:hypothetical protein
MERKIALYLGLIGFWAMSHGTAIAQYPVITIDPGDGGSFPPCEPSIAISPKNPDHIVAGAILDKVYRSEDGGETWTIDQLESRYGVFGDPCILAGPRGDFYYFHLSDPAGKGWMDASLLDRIVVQRSRSKGKRWNKGVGIGLNGDRDQDKEWGSVDLRNGNIALTWTEFEKYNSNEEEDSTLILFSTSDRKAKKWSKPVRINKYAGDCKDGDLTVEGAVPSYGPNGEIYVAWAWNETIWFDRSLDGGKTWLENDIPATSIVGGWDQAIPGVMRANGMPVTKCDLSDGGNKGTIYINWTDQRNGIDNTDVWLVSSSDGGLNWTDPVKVNNDDSERHQFFTWMDVDPVTGHIYIVFYDRRSTEGVDTEVYLAVSRDGGKSFENIKISDKAFTPTPYVFFGDYNNISAYDSRVRPIWTVIEEGKLKIKTALVDFPK